MNTPKIMFFLVELAKILKNIEIEPKIRAKLSALIQIISDEVMKNV